MAVKAATFIWMALDTASAYLGQVSQSLLRSGPTDHSPHAETPLHSNLAATSRLQNSRQVTYCQLLHQGDKNA